VENLDLGWQKVKEMTPAPLHELGARVGITQPTMAEEIKFGAEKMGTAGPTAKLNEMTETVKEKGTQVLIDTQETVQGLSDSVKENLEFGRNKVIVATETPGPLHELGARVGLVQPTMAEEIKFGAEKMGTAGPTAKLNEMTETVKEKGAQVWNQTQDKVQEYNEKIKEITPRPIHELGARVGLVQPTMAEEIKFGAEKMGTAGPTAKLNEIGTKLQENVAVGTETVREKSVKLWTDTQEKVQEYNEMIKENVELGKEKVKEMTPAPIHELGARVGIVQPTMLEEIKFGAEKMGTAGPTAKLHEVTEKTAQAWTKVLDYNEKIEDNVELGKEKVIQEIEVMKENVQLDTENKESVKRLHIHLHNVEKEKLKNADIHLHNIEKEDVVVTEKKKVVVLETENRRGSV